MRGLWALIANDDDNKKALCKEHGIPSIVRVMKAHPDCCELQSASCMVIS